jgi:alanine racemase
MKIVSVQKQTKAGQRTRLVGRVSMDMLAVDLSALPQAGLGSEVTLWGQASTGERMPIDEVAAAAGTVGYQLMCALARRVPVRVLDEAV